MTKSDDIARHCIKRCASWPDRDEFVTCPLCKTLTRRFKGLRPISDEQAKSLVRHVEFEEFYSTVWIAKQPSHLP